MGETEKNSNSTIFTQARSTFAQTQYQEMMDAFGSAAEDAGNPMPEALCQWLGRLRLLYGVPFEYLVPDPRFLPMESIRFFFLDRNWADRLVDGALSVGKATTREYLFHEANSGNIREELDQEELSVRERLRELPLELRNNFLFAGLTSGLLLRSSLVSDFPGLEIRGFSHKTIQAFKTPLLRMDRLAPDIMLCIFAGVPVKVEIIEPREGIQFGLDREGDGFFITPRKETGDADTPEDPQAEPKRVDITFRDRDKRVLDVTQLAKDLAPMETWHDSPNHLNSAELSIHLLQYPYKQIFEGEGEEDHVIPDMYETGCVQIGVQNVTTEQIQGLFPQQDTTALTMVFNDLEKED